MRFLVIGAGLQGSACALDLLRTPSAEKVYLADRTFDRLPPFLQAARPDARLELVTLRLEDHEAVKVVMSQVRSVLSAAPYYFNGDLARLAVECGAHFADLGGNTAIVQEQKRLDAAAKAKGVSVIPDCGLAPGMINILSGEGIRRLDEVDSVRIYVGGLPQDPEPPLNYMVVYSLEGALDYYTTPSWILRDRKRVQVDALSELEEVEFPAPLGKLEAFHTGGGISTMPFEYEGKVPVMEYKTLRYPGHVAIMRPIRELGLLGMEPVEADGSRVRPRSVFIAAVSPKLTKPKGKDLVALRVDVRGRKAGKPAGTRWQMVDHYDEQHGVTAMMRTTGYSLAITGVMQADGRISRRGAFVPDEGVPAKPYVDELAARGVVIEESPL
jgi:lysine 6-dehydrogenase